MLAWFTSGLQGFMQIKKFILPWGIFSKHTLFSPDGAFYGINPPLPLTQPESATADTEKNLLYSTS